MTFQEIKTQLLTLLDDDDITDVQAGIWVNAYYRLLLREYAWPFVKATGTYTVTSGTQETAFTGFSTSITNFAKPLKVWIASSSTSDRTPLPPVDWENRNVPGLSGHYYITPSNLKIGLIPSPTNSTNVVTMDYLVSTTDLSSASDTPLFVSDFHWILVFKPLIAYQFQQRESSDEFQRSYNEILNQMLKFYNMVESGRVPILSRGFTKASLPADSPFRI